MQGNIITSGISILAALKLMDEIGRKLLIVIDNERFAGVVSIGDIQRAIIRQKPMETPVSEILREEITVASGHESFESIKMKMIALRTECMPVVDDQNKLVRVIFWEDLFGGRKREPLFRFNLPVVIMAGGMGSRMKPLTNVLPKPLIPIHDKTLLEEIFEHFHHHGCDTFHLSVHYKAELIEHYLSQRHLPYKIHYLREPHPMGTAGSLALLRGKITETFFISNCDIVVEQDYSEVLQYHRDNQNEITLVAALKHYPMNYGIIDTGENGKLVELVEKPELTVKINSGMYIVEPHLLDEIPVNTFYHITQLINGVKSRDGRIGVFPVSEKSWKDFGDWSLFLKENQIDAR